VSKIYEVVPPILLETGKVNGVTYYTHHPLTISIFSPMHLEFESPILVLPFPLF
jgi:hypothetical protein